ncbi:Bor family protein [Marinicellulosiphila megalodicopiae]|uniref:Bor family protein n=1 Tax=Marinicellulosiphila megalodicopiae TaxID=2724896 RepID=UPI003BAF98AD
MKLKLLIGTIIIATTVSCSNVTIKPSPVEVSGPATYKATVPFYFGGPLGERHIDVVSICGNVAPKQMRAKTSFVNGLLAGLTIGIYTPKTVEVWC